MKTTIKSEKNKQTNRWTHIFRISVVNRWTTERLLVAVGICSCTAYNYSFLVSGRKTFLEYQPPFLPPSVVSSSPESQSLDKHDHGICLYVVVDV